MLAHLKFKARNRFVNLLRRVGLDVFQLQRHLEVVSLRRRDQRRLNWFDNRLRGDAVLAIVDFLQFTAATSFVNRPLHRISHAIGVKYRFAVRITRGPSDCLNQR